jgi:hypothetical protein
MFSNFGLKKKYSLFFKKYFSLVSKIVVESHRLGFAPADCFEK